MSDDHEAIRNLLGRYAKAVDDRDFEAVAACFTPDAVASYSGLKIPPGRDNIISHIRGVSRTIHSQHFIHPIIIEIDGDKATTLSYAMAMLMQNTDDGVQSLARGLTYTDKLRRTDGTWQIYDRLHTADWQWTLPVQMTPGGMWEVDPSGKSVPSIFRTVVQ
jgi:uncharacterized protein (TIGR02246 family)